MIGLPFAGDGLVHAGLSDPRLWPIVGFAVAFGAIGSRVLTWDVSRQGSLADWWENGDLSVLAGLVGAWLGVHLGKRLTHYGESTRDLLAPAVSLVLVIGCVGCLLTELPGTPTGGAWGITLTPGQAAMLGGPPGVGPHPSFAFEILFHVAAFALMWRYRDRLPRPGDLFICYVTSYALFRLFRSGVEFVRGKELFWPGMSRPQWFLLMFLPLLLWRMMRDSGNHSAQSRKEEGHERRQPRRSLEPTATAPRRGAAL